MPDVTDEIPEIREAIDRDRKGLLTVIGALATLVGCLIILSLSLGVATVSALHDRQVLSVSLDDQRLQYYTCLRDHTSTDDCDRELVSPPSRDIIRESSTTRVTDVLLHDVEIKDLTHDEDHGRVAYGLLGRIIH